MGIEDVLNECLEAILRGESEESCLMRYPEQATELRPLLQAMSACCEVGRVSPQPEYRARARYEYHRAVTEVCTRSTRQGFRWSWRWSTAVPLAVAIIMIASGGVVAASANALPGQPLYEVKLMAEGLQIRFTPAGEYRTRVYALLAERRLEEITVLTKRGEYDLADKTSLRLETALNEVTGYLGVKVVGKGASEIQYFSSDNIIVTMPTVSTILATPSPAIDGFTMTGENSANAPPQIVLQADVEPELLNTLQASALQGRDKLLALLDEVPEGSQEMIWYAVNSYEAILDLPPVCPN